MFRPYRAAAGQQYGRPAGAADGRVPVGVLDNGLEPRVDVPHFDAADRVRLVPQPEHGAGGARARRPERPGQYQLPAQPRSAGAHHGREYRADARHRPGPVPAARRQHLPACHVLLL